jgi:3-deoxy-D-manno-octulosonic-acid transferase
LTKPPLIFHFLKGLLLLARPWYPLLTRRLGKSPGLKGTMEPRLMREKIQPAIPPSIWLHAVSVGEVEAAIPIALRIIEKWGADSLLVTTTTKEGYAVAEKKIVELKHLTYYPFDIPHIIDTFLDHYTPSLYICMETELWPILTSALQKRNIQMILANGRISDRLKATPWLLRPLYRWMFQSYNWIGLQTDEDLLRLKSFTSKTDNAVIAGNTKFDLPDPSLKPDELADLMRSMGLRDGSVIVFGSTHPGEEEIIAEVFNALKERLNDISMILAPRHITRSDEVASILKSAGITFNTRTDTLDRKLNHQNADCLLLDTVGELTRMYSLGQIAFVGGSLIKRGGHNLLEPAAAGLPVLHGPYMDNFRAITSFLHNANAALEVKDGESLKNAIYELLSDSGKLTRMKQNSLNAYEKGKGATDKIISKIEELIP